MNDYIALRLDVTPAGEDTTDLLAAFLADAGYESFEPDASGLTAYIKAGDYDADQVKGIVADFPIPARISFSTSLVEGKDWNEEWEKNYFQPIIIDGRCVIHSTFHKDVPAAEYDIVIDPKMSFGTGHHATTSMMLRHLLGADLKGKRIIDMGTGTGILSILAKMRGAGEVYGIEIDPGACVNAEENVGLNGVDVTILEGDSSRLAEIPAAEVFIANINRNVILADLQRYAGSLLPGGMMYLSGFYESDIPLLERAAGMYGLSLKEVMTEAESGVDGADPASAHGPWASIRLKKATK